MGKAAKNISGQFQRTWIFRFTLVSLLGSAAMLIVLKEVFTRDLTADYSKAFTILKNMEGLLLPLVGLSAFFYIVVASVLAAIVIYYLSHSVVDPLFRIESAARLLRRGDLSDPIGVEPGDQLEELVISTEKLRKRYWDQLTSVRTHFGTIDGAWETIDDALAESDRDTVMKSLATIEEQLALIGNELED
jgi:methyl-accepting chemotaxis protein